LRLWLHASTAQALEALLKDIENRVTTFIIDLFGMLGTYALSLAERRASRKLPIPPKIKLPDGSTLGDFINRHIANMSRESFSAA
jgi:hypothetical protein